LGDKDELININIDESNLGNSSIIHNFNSMDKNDSSNEKELIQWLYDNQSQQGRKHLKNRLFIIMYDKNNQHWKMKSEIMELKKEIDLYVDDFSQSNLYEFDFGDGKVYSDILWITKE